MNKGMITALILLVSVAPVFAANIYKVVDENGNVTFTDQRPGPGAQPMDLPPLSVVETEPPQPPATASTAEAGDEESAEKPLTVQQLRRLYRDFRITQPQNEETFWGTANTVVVSWGSSAAIADDMKVTLYVNGEAQSVPVAGSISLTLNRGEHSVRAELRDASNRKIVTTENVRFFVKQHSVNFGLSRMPGSPDYGF